jgi:hypothetical protein
MAPAGLPRWAGPSSWEMTATGSGGTAFAHSQARGRALEKQRICVTETTIIKSRNDVCRASWEQSASHRVEERGIMFGSGSEWLRVVAVSCCALLVPGEVPLMAQQPSPAPAAATPAEAPTPIPADQLDSLVAPIALYPDPLLAQVLAASTYPLEIVQLQQWLAKHKDLKDKALADAVQKEKWDPSIQGMAALPDVVKQLAENIAWTSELGNAFLAQQSDVMEAVQRMRGKAKDAGKLSSNEQIKVETKVVESKSVVVIEQTNPQVVYVPSYDPVVVWGAAPYYAYPPIVYPPGYYAAGVALSFGVGLAMGAMWGGGWGYGCGWGGGGNNNININNSNNFNRNSNRNGGGNRVGGGNNSWQHNPQHRGGAPYGDRATANKFGGTARGDSLGNRQANARQNAGQRGGGAGDRGAGGSSSFRSDRGAGGGAGAGANRGGGGGDRVGNRQTSGGGSRGSGAFGSSGTSGSSARSSGSRGSSSFGGSRGGGGGGSRGGGGGRRR